MGARRLAGFTAAVALALPAAAHAAPASLDAGFGTGGNAVTGWPGRAPASAGMTLDDDGSAVFAASTGPMEAGLLRLAPGGTTDVATLRPLGPGSGSGIDRVIEQPGHGYLAGGWVDRPPAGRSFALVRYTAAGAPDDAFGLVTATPGDDDELRALALLPGGGILAAGRSGDRIGLARYSADGVPEDSSTLDLATVTGEEASAALVEPGGRVVLAG